MAATKLGRIQCVDGSRKYFALLDVKSSESDSMSIVLTDVGRKAWTGSLNSEFLKVHAERTKCTVEKYVSMTFSCLTEAAAVTACTDPVEHDKGSTYVCQVKELDNGDAELTWKRQLVDDDIAVKLGTTRLRASDLSDCLRTILAFGVNRIRELEQLTREQQIREESHVQERKMIMDKLNTCVTAKEEMERDLYAKFVAVLNEKKAEIRRLSTDQSMKTVTAEVKSAINNTLPKKSMKRVAAEPAIESDPDDLSDEDVGDSQALVVGRRKQANPRSRSTPADDDLLLDDDDRAIHVTSSLSLPRARKKSAEKPASSVRAASQVGGCAPSTSKVLKWSEDEVDELGHRDNTFDTEGLFDEM